MDELNPNHNLNDTIAELPINLFEKTNKSSICRENEEYLGGKHAPSKLLKHFSPLPTKKLISKFLYFYSPYSPKANL